jgi:DNA-directed RNA polymerase specialized sigma24 family protein
MEHLDEIYSIAFRLAQGDRETAERLSEDTYRSALAKPPRRSSEIRLHLFRTLIVESRKRPEEPTRRLAPVPKDEAERLNQLLDELPGPQREAALLIDCADFTPLEAAVILGIGSGELSLNLSLARSAYEVELGAPSVAIQ